MKIAHLTTGHLHNDSRIYVKQCRSLVDAGHEVHLVVAVEKVHGIFDGVQVHHVPRIARDRWTRLLVSGLDVVKYGLSLKPDVFHLHDPNLLPFIPILKKHGKVIYDSHEHLPRQIFARDYIPTYLQPLISYLSEKIENLFVQKSDLVIAATEPIQDRFVKHGIKCVCVRNFPLADEIYPGPIPLEERPTSVAYVGSIAECRGIRTMIRAIAGTPYRLVLAGPIGPELLKELRDEPGWSQVDWKGLVGRQQVREILGEARAGLVLLQPLPNYIDSLPIKMLEYMSAGLPVIASDFDYWNTLLEDSGVAVDPLDISAIRNAICQTIENPELAHSRGTCGRKMVTEVYNWNLEKENLLNAYNLI